MRTYKQATDDFFFNINFIYLCRPIALSSNGRTSDFDSECIGSNPVRATIFKTLQTMFGGFFISKMGLIDFIKSSYLEE